MTSRFPMLQKKQDVVRFANIVSPPFEKGTMWSTHNFAPSLGVEPQYWQVKLSLAKIANRILRRTSLIFSSGNFLFRYCGGSRGVLPIVCNALHIPPHFSYCDLQGNPGILFISVPRTLRPFKIQASSSLAKRYSTVINPFLRLYNFIINIVLLFFVKYK